MLIGFFPSPREAGSADHRFCGPRLFGPLMERSNSRAHIGGHSHAVHDQTVRRLTDSSALRPAYSLQRDHRQSSGRLTKPAYRVKQVARASTRSADHRVCGLRLLPNSSDVTMFLITNGR